MTTGKTIALSSQTFVGKVVSLLFNILPRLLSPNLVETTLKLLWERKVPEHEEHSLKGLLLQW